MAQKVLEALVAIVTDHTIFDLSSLVKTNQRFSTVREKRFSSVCVLLLGERQVSNKGNFLLICLKKTLFSCEIFIPVTLKR